MTGDHSAAEVRALADEVSPRWWHSIDLGHGVVTDGNKSPEVMRRELEALRLPDLAGRSVLDVGAWDGGFSFACERAGAARVVALDHYIWSIDLHAKYAYSRRCAAEGVVPRPYEEVPEVWHPDTLPGKQGFDVAHAVLGSRVEPVVGELETTDLAELGTFDVVLYLGVLYHVIDPIRALRRLAAVTRDLAIIETEMLRFHDGPGTEAMSLFELLQGSELNDDPTNYWVPSVAGLRAACLDAGFTSVETFVDEEPAAEGRRTLPQRLRAAYERARYAPPPVTMERFRAVTHARR